MLKSPVGLRNTVDYAINVAGFGNTGCTVQADYLSEFRGVRGVLLDPDRNLQVCAAPYQELGILKCKYSLAGPILDKLLGLNYGITKPQLLQSLQGELPDGEQLNASALWHLGQRKKLSTQCGKAYSSVVEDCVAALPNNLTGTSLSELLEAANVALDIWLDGIRSLLESEQDNLGCAGVDKIGLKNDPPGAYPLLASLGSNVMTSAILRDPRDTIFDFNRHYNIESSVESILWACNHYNSQLRSAWGQIKTFEKRIAGHYFVHSFEEFARSASQRKKYSLTMVGERPHKKLFFDSDQSYSNVGFYHSMPRELTALVEEHSMPVYDDFVLFLTDRGLFL